VWRRTLTGSRPGVQMTIRNSAAHGVGELDEQAALERLTTLSLLARWLDECDLVEAPDQPAPEQPADEHAPVVSSTHPVRTGGALPRVIAVATRPATAVCAGGRGLVQSVAARPATSRR
jgi:hypothetical protein